MAINRFWENVRRAVRLDNQHSVLDAPRLDPDRLVGMGDSSWLLPRTVAGYDSAEFDYLPDERLRNLDERVQAFLKAAGRAVQTRSPDATDVTTARDALRGIVEELEFDRFADPDAHRVARTIEGLAEFPRDEVVDARYQVRRDSNGEPSVKIMVYLRDGDPDQFPKLALGIRRRIGDLVFQHGLPYWPYVSARVASDIELLAAGEVE